MKSELLYANDTMYVSYVCPICSKNHRKELGPCEGHPYKRIKFDCLDIKKLKSERVPRKAKHLNMKDMQHAGFSI
jgi:hypothetical protein